MSDLRHHGVAGVDAKPALNAAEIGAVADIDPGRAHHHALQAVDAIAGRKPVQAQRFVLLDRPARLAAIVAVGDVEGIFVDERRLNPRPGTHVDADLLAHMPGQRIGRERQYADPRIGRERRLQGGEVPDQGGGVGEIEHPGAAGPPGDHEPEKVLGRLAGQVGRRPRSPIAQHVLAAIAFDPALDGQEKIGPNRLRAEIAAPEPAGDRVHQEQGHRRQDEQAGEVIDLLRPKLDEEEVEAPARQVDQHRLVGRAGSPVPADERQRVVDPERDQQQDPFDPADTSRARSADRSCGAPRRTGRHPGPVPPRSRR